MLVLSTEPEVYGERLAAGVREACLDDNGNPGRFLVAGRSTEGILTIGYAAGGRSDASKHRRAIEEDDAVRLVVPEMSEEEMAAIPDAPLRYYHALDTRRGVFVVSNGAQTRPVLNAKASGSTFVSAVENAPTVRGTVNGEEQDIDLSSYEPDDPNFTPRITAAIDVRDHAHMPLSFAIARRMGEHDTVRAFSGVESLGAIADGQGWALQTYGPNNPDDSKAIPPSFDKSPYPFLLEGSTKDIADTIAEAVGERTLATVIVRQINEERHKWGAQTILNTC